ncbi:MAG: alpha/beta hydrolase [Eggerthellaceae bacterium]|jgi:acetyl esterase/lipase
MGKKRIIPLMVGAAAGAYAAYAISSGRKAERAAHLPMTRFDKELQPAGWAFRLDPLMRDITPDKLRFGSAMCRYLKMPEYPELHHWTETVHGRGANFTVHIFSPLEAAEKLPVVEWMHGGGFALNTTAVVMPLVRKLIAAAPSIFVLPEYRLSTEAQAPAAADDCYDCLIWIKENIGRLNGRPDQIFVGGTSAGGGLACAVTQMARDWGKVNVAFQMPLYPMLDDRMITASSRDNDAPWWNANANSSAWRLYLGPITGTDEVTKYMAPARETDFTGLPPMYSFVGELDPFADEIIAYFTQMREAGVQAFLDIYPKCYHGFDLIAPYAAVSQRAEERLCAAFRRAVNSYHAAN